MSSSWLIYGKCGCFDVIKSFQFCSLLAGVREIHVEHSREHELPATGNVNRDIIIYEWDEGSTDAVQCSVASLVKVGGWTHQTVTGDSQWSPRSIALVSSQIRRSTSQVTSHNHDMSRVSRRELSTFHWSCHGTISIKECENTIQFRFHLKY